MQGSVRYNLTFAAIVCVVCAVVVSGSAVSLRDRQVANELLEKQRNVLVAAGLAAEEERLTAEEVADRFGPIAPVVIDLRSGEPAEQIDAETFDQAVATTDPATSRAVAENRAGVMRVPDYALVYELRNEMGDLDLVVLPVSGVGLWSTLYGFIAVDADLRTVRGLTFYEHGETPGLGGEVDNPRWKALWPGRALFDDSGQARIEVIRGRAGSTAEDPYRVDGLAGATITSRSVTNLLRFWLGEQGFGPYFDRLREGGV